MDSEVRDLTLRTGITVPCLIHDDGDAKPVLLLHAWGESSRSFDRLIPGLTGFRVYAPDLRGQAGADKPEHGYSLAEQAEWGAEDGLLSRRGQETLAARIPGSVLKVHPGVAHPVLWECPDQVAEDTTAFLASLD